MEGNRFDHVTRAFAKLRSRRAILLWIGGMVAAATPGPDDAAAKRGKSRKRKHVHDEGKGKGKHKGKGNKKGHKKPCKAPRAMCDGDCVAIQSDDRHCGVCGNQCAAGQTCAAGQCTGGGSPNGGGNNGGPATDCPAGSCCVDNDICNGDGRCRGGQCQPRPNCHPAGDTPALEDTVPCCSENASCQAGTSGVECTCLSGEPGKNCLSDSDCKSNHCVGYQCVGCPAGMYECSGQCVPLDSNFHCGTCGHVCARGDFCHNQTCQPRYVADAHWSIGSSDAIFVDSSDTVFVAYQHCVQQYSSAGVLQYTYGVCSTSGSDNQHFSDPQGVAANAGIVFISDAHNYRVQVFARNGSWLGNLASGEGSGAYQVRFPDEIAIDADGNIYVADYANDRVQKFGPNGVYQRTFGGTQGSGNTQLSGALGVAVDRFGSVYVPDRFNDRVQKFDSAGGFLQTFGGNGNGENPGQVFQPSSVAVASNGDVFVADYLNERVQQFNKNGEVVRIFKGDPLRVPRGVAVDAHDNLWVADNESGIVRFTLKSPKPS